MDQVYQDIHYVDDLRKESIIYREVHIKSIDMDDATIEFKIIDKGELKTLLFPKLRGFKLIID